MSPHVRLQRLPWPTGKAGTRTYVVRGSLLDDAPDIDVPMGSLRGTWWDLPLPPCPDCGGTLAWSRVGSAQSARLCRRCGSLFRVTVDPLHEGPAETS